MHLFTDIIGLWVLDCTYHYFDVQYSQQMIKSEPRTLSFIVMNAWHWSGIAGKLFLFKSHSSMVTKFVKNTNNLDKVSGGVDAGKCWGFNFTMQCRCKSGTDQVNCNLIPTPKDLWQYPYQGADHVKGQKVSNIGIHHKQNCQCVHKTAVDGSNFEL